MHTARRYGRTPQKAPARSKPFFHFFYQYARAREIVVTKSPTHKVNGANSQSSYALDGRAVTLSILPADCWRENIRCKPKSVATDPSISRIVLPESGTGVHQRLYCE